MFSRTPKQNPRRFPRISLYMIIFLLLLGAAGFAYGAGDHISRPVQVTASSDPVTHFAVSADGNTILYITRVSDFATLWLGSADPAVTVLPRRLVSDPFLKSDPAISPDGRYAAYAGTIDDVKGDIFLIDLSKTDAEPVRLTGRETEDGGPCFSPDGKSLYFHRAGPDSNFQIWRIDLSESKPLPVIIDTGGDGRFPAISADGTRLAFVSFRSHPSGDLFVYNLDQKTAAPVTRGPAMDMAPCWSGDGRTLYFASIAADTDRDGRLTSNDRSVIFRVQMDADGLPVPLTPLDTAAFSPRITDKSLYFLFNHQGTLNCWTTPSDGWIHSLETARAQAAAAEQISGRLQENPYVSLLAWYRVLEGFPTDRPACAAAAHRIGSLYQRLNLPEAAIATYELVMAAYPDIDPYSGLAQIQARVIRFETHAGRLTHQSEKDQLMDAALADLSGLEKSASPRVRLEAKIGKAALLIWATNAPDRMVQSISILDEILSDPDADPPHMARALFLKANAYEKLSISKSAADVYRTLMLQYPDQPLWADPAVDRYLDGILAALPPDAFQERLRRLHQIAAKNKSEIPLLSMGALNRIGDLYAAQESIPLAKAAYQQVLDTYPGAAARTAAARLSLAELFYREEQFRKALDLYETEIERRPEEDRIWQLARQGYIRKKTAAGEYHYRLGEVPTARGHFAELMAYDDAIVEAHRGYIKCAAAEGDLQAVIETYRKRIAESPGNAVLLYAAGLSLTYLESEAALTEAQDLIRRAVGINGRVEYFYQTLGYIHEVMETVYQKPRQLELALDAYQKAYFLNDHAANPENAANLELNLGNGFYLLKQYGKALDYYDRREKQKAPFDSASTEIIFYKRLSECAFQENDTPRAAAAFTQTLKHIDAGMDPVAASRAFDQLHAFIRDRITAPAAKLDQTAKTADQVLAGQADIGRRVAALTREASAPPSTRWRNYHAGMQALLIEQKTLNAKAAGLAKELNALADAGKTGARVEDPERVIAALTARIEQALEFPERLVTMRAEILDRMGLAFQESGQFKEAADVFEQAFDLNRRTQNHVNLSRNRRAAAYNTYMLAQTATGRGRITLLEKSADQFQQVLDLVNQYGVPEFKDEDSGSGLVNLSIQTSLDAASSTQAGRGFSKEQEIRLSRTFLSRIATELGHFEQAGRLLEHQLADYPAGKAIAVSDQYGVSLLLHRAGLLAYAQGDLNSAFVHFDASAKLCLEMKNPVSAMINVMNMAAILSGRPDRETPPGDGTPEFSRLSVLDRQVVDLLKTNPPPGRNDMRVSYHLAMGVCHAGSGKRSGTGLEESVRTLDALMTAQSHFQQGLDLISTDNRQNRKTAEQKAMLHLNMACLADMLGDGASARSHRESSLPACDQGMFPDLKWRALAGLGRLNEALEALEHVTLMRAGCRPFEIIHAFSPLVIADARSGQAEAAFNLAERLSELERFNRTALFIRPANAGETNFYQTVFPRLQRIGELKTRSEDAPDADQNFITDRIAQETLLLQQDTGPEGEYLPGIIRQMSDPGARMEMVHLFGLALEIEAAAESLYGQASSEARGRYDQLVRQYHETARRGAGREDKAGSAHIFALVSPEAMELMDVQSALKPESDMMLRLVATGLADPAFLLFTVTPEEISVIETADPAGAIAAQGEENTYIAYEDPGALSGIPLHPYALSGTHLVRSMAAKKPFKRNLLAISPAPGMADLAEIYDLRTISAFPSTPDESFVNLLADTHALASTGPLRYAATVPTEPGNRPQPIVSLSPAGDSIYPAEDLLALAPGISMAFLADAPVSDPYIAGHLFAIFGCSQLIMAGPDEQTEDLLFDLLDAYPALPAYDALKNSLDRTFNSRVIYLGHRGLDQKAAADLARQHFAEYVKTGRAAFDAGNARSALMMFENAVTVATEVSDYAGYLPALYRYCRESAYLSGDLEKAVHYSRLLADAMADQKPDSREHAEAMLRLGMLYAKLEDFKQAVPVITEAVEMMEALDIDADLVNAMVDLGIVLENATDYDSALGRFDSAANLSRTLGRGELFAAQQYNIGRIYDLRLNQYAVAMGYYRTALEGFIAAGDTNRSIEAMVDIGRCSRLLGNFAQADLQYAQALDMAEKMPEEPAGLLLKIIIEQANNAWFTGRYETAFRLQRRCAAMADDLGDDAMKVMVQNTAGLIWWTLGDTEKAMTELENALALAKTLTVRKDEVATTWNNMGLIHRERWDFSAALDCFDQALAIDREIGSRWGIAYDSRNKGLTYLMMDAPEKAVPLFTEALDISRAIGNRINMAKALIGLGDARLLLDEPGPAQAAYAEGLEASEAMQLKETQWRALHGLARIALTKNDSEAAEDYLRRAVEVIEGLRSDIKIDQLNKNYLSGKMDVYEDLIRLLADAGKPVEAFEVAERSRGRNFIDLLGNQRITFKSGTDQALYERHRAIESQIAEYEALLASAERAEEKELFGNRLKNLKNDLDNLMIDMQAANPQLSAFVSVPPVDSERILETLEPGTALAAFYLLEREVLCWILTADKTGDTNQIRLFRTPADREALGSRILDYRRAIQNLEPFESDSRDLFEKLLLPARGMLENVRTLGIIPQGALHYLSFATLLDGDRFLIDSHSLFYLPSASMFEFAVQRRSNTPKSDLEVLAIGNPDLGDPLLALPFAEREVNTIQWNFPAITILTGALATEEWVKENIDRFEIIHLASHGEFDPVNPLLSAIKLAPSEIDAEAAVHTDGDLQAGEVFGLDIKADLVFLSACQTGLAEITAGDDIIGLNRSFFYAGTHAIVSSLWRVSDVSTAMLIKTFYRRYTAGNKADSLARAMHHVKRRYPHPGYWGAFTLVGDYQ